MQKMRKIILPPLISAVMLLLTACGSPGQIPEPSGEPAATPESAVGLEPTPEPMPEPTPEITPELTPERVQNIKPPVSPELPSEWSSFSFELEGVIYTLPFQYSELEMNGWFSDSETLDEVLGPDEYIVGGTTIEYANKDNTEISIQFVNLGDEELPARECYVGRIQLVIFSWNEDTSLYFPGGITIGSTMDEVEALYGEPGSISELSSTVEWEYQTEIYTRVALTFTAETGVIEKLVMTNMWLPD